MEIRWAGGLAEPEHRSFRQNFFWRIFKVTEIFPIFSFFYFMISPPNRPFLAYLQKKISPLQIFVDL